MKKILIFLICFLGMIFINCYYEVNNDIEIKIVNNSSQDLHISFSPNTFIFDDIGQYNEKITVKLKDVNVKKGKSFLLIVKFRYKQNNFGDHISIKYNIDIGGIEKIIFSEMDTRELIKEVDNKGLIKEDYSYRNNYTLEITDELLKGE